ncbi:hypothetical protein EUTSA_v10015344mg [Eutrema salsugineum]|uniref:RING-type domain-containing protein n=1 Tax=Eutrema salsugineum TaxID=72664 RepID=V4LLG9_EUTSA|nr:hypothetical protein EUTSA_v10015344mg [Eutrema salsugineum]
MSRFVNHLSLDEKMALFLQYGLSEDSEPTTNDDVIAREIQQEYQNNLMFDDVAIALEIEREEVSYLYDDDDIYARTLQNIEGDLSTSLSDDEKLARDLQQQNESANGIDVDVQETHQYQPIQVIHPSIPQRDAPSTSRAFFHYEDGDHFSGHHTHTRTSSNISSINSQNVPNENIDPANMTYEELNELEDSIGDVCRGLSQRKISKLPTHKYGSKTKTRWWQIKKNKFVATDTQCSICLVDYANGDKIKTLPCNHIYHKDCISNWLKLNNTCCVCKAEV